MSAASAKLAVKRKGGVIKTKQEEKRNPVSSFVQTKPVKSVKHHVQWNQCSLTDFLRAKRKDQIAN